jgi:hypothetical protein
MSVRATSIITWLDPSQPHHLNGSHRDIAQIGATSNIAVPFVTPGSTKGIDILYLWL